MSNLDVRKITFGMNDYLTNNSLFTLTNKKLLNSNITVNVHLVRQKN